ncbi:extracellular solute-binding protein [Glycocaulis profundi]|nr:extracellular solute-binding protein [Glycocaulis profundi]
MTLRALAPLAMILALAGCGPRDDRTVVEFWAMGSEGLAVGPLIEAFEAENPDLRVRLQQIPYRVAHEKLLTAFAGNATPDVAQLGNTWIPEMSALGALHPLDGRVAASGVIDPSDYFEGIWQASLSGGALKGVPWYVDTRLMFYRADLVEAAGFDGPPADWAEWRAMMEALTEGGHARYGALLPLNEFEPYVALALQQDAPILRDGGRYGNFSHPEHVALMDFYLGLFRDGLAVRATNTQIANLYQEFDRGFYAFYVTGPWNLGEFARRIPADRQDIWATAALPGPAGPGASSAGGSSLVVFERSENKDAAFRFIEFLSRPEIQLEFYDLVGDLPVRRSAWEDARLDEPRAAAFRDQLDRLEPSPDVPEWERIATEIRLVIERAVHEGWTAAQTAAELDARADAMLEKRRWMLDRDAAELTEAAP